jgi:NADPH-dependent glutamate synthase beta subunit-like oxidoreductase/nitroreductase
MALWEKDKADNKEGIRFVDRVYKPSKFSTMIDPPVATAPMGINLDEDKCIGCAVCLRQCPSQVLSMARRTAPSKRQSPACQFNCPAGIDIRSYLKLLADGASFEKAWNVLTRTNPFPAITGRVCPHPCESACNRTYLDEAVNINCIERAVGDFGIEKGLAFEKTAKRRDEKVAVVGSGPSGLSCAYQLVLMGYQVSVFEANEKPGGMLRYAIPSYRLPEAVVDKEIGRIADLGVDLKLNTAVGKDITLHELKKTFKAMYIAVGAQGSTSLGIAGEDGKNTITGLSFLRAVKENKKPQLGKKVLVIGGGNTAIDAARTARRLGSDVTIAYRRTITEMPAYAAEVEAAEEEGVKMEFLCAPVKMSGNGKVTCQRMELGETDASGRPRPVPVKGSEFDIEFGTMIVAIGQDLDRTGIEDVARSSAWISADGIGQTKDKGVFAGGDAVSGPGLVSHAIGAGRKAALTIDAFIRGVPFTPDEKVEITYRGIPLEGTYHLKACEGIKRGEAKKLDAAKRLANPDGEEILPFGNDSAITESKRCMECGMFKTEYNGLRDIPYWGKVCLACHNCDAICPQGALSMNTFYRIDEGRWATALDVPVDLKDGLPNPLRLPRPVPFEEIESKITPTEKVIYTRRSVRVFKKDPVPRELVERVLEAGRFAPTAGNCLGVKFVVITDKGLMKELSNATVGFLGNIVKVFREKGPGKDMIKRLLTLIFANGTDPRPNAAVTGVCFPQFGDGNPVDVFFGAPCAIMVVPHALHISDKELGMGITCQNMVLAAHSLGLGTCYVGLVTNTINKDFKSKAKFKKRLGLSWPFDKPAMFLLMGYPAVHIDRAVTRDFPPVEWIE